ncbi:thermonuclease family protein [Streptomyces sp. NPDC016309]|uniref:thermonuclease family protein n=1 Tax=Streptomyces sp. NPDC016309 TaxID=3364965 RepID=UPI0036FE56CE
MRPRRPWLTALLAALVAVIAFGGLGGLLEAAKDEPGSAGVEPRPPGVPDGREPVLPRPPAEQPAVPPPRGPVVLRVIDGDTVEVRGDGRLIPAGTRARVRLLEIDTPEHGDCFSAEAAARTASLLPPGSTLNAETDQDPKDPYGRYLLYVWNERGVFVNEALVRDGYARAVLYAPNDAHWPRISRAESAARRSGAGLWAACGTTP